MEKEDLLEKFWGLYDKYIISKDESMMQELSFLLGKLEIKSRRE